VFGVWLKCIVLPSKCKALSSNPSTRKKKFFKITLYVAIISKDTPTSSLHNNSLGNSIRSYKVTRETQPSAALTLREEIDELTSQKSNRSPKALPPVRRPRIQRYFHDLYY
jgi:hypothetical protein